MRSNTHGNTNGIIDYAKPKHTEDVGGIRVQWKSAFIKEKLLTVSIPGSVTGIGDYAFFENEIISITVGENVSMGKLPVGRLWAKFLELYNCNGRQAGTYVFAEENWTKAD